MTRTLPSLIAAAALALVPGYALAQHIHVESGHEHEHVEKKHEHVDTHTEKHGEGHGEDHGDSHSHTTVIKEKHGH